jgi:hypothetical protein
MLIKDFKEFDEMVKTYYPLNKEKNRYLILFYSGDFAFYNYDKKKNVFIKMKGGFKNGK